MTTLIERVSDRFLEWFVPGAEAAAMDRCGCECIQCCVWQQGLMSGRKCYDCISGHRCGCELNGRSCPPIGR